MRRREFLSKCGLLIGGLGVAARDTSAAPCRPTELSALGGTSEASVDCEIDQTGVGDTLQQIAEALSPGNYADMPLSAQNPLTLVNPEISWQTICWYDESRSELQYMGAPQASFTIDHQHYIFDERTNRWRTTGQSLFPSTGHIWSSAFDPATGDYFFKRMTTDDETIRWMQRSVEAGAGTTNDPWTRTSGTPELGQTPGQKCGMAWHPNLFGSGDGGIAVFSNDRVVGWRKSTDSWSDIWVFGGNQSYSNLRNGSGIYLPGSDEVILGTGVDANTLLYVEAGSGGSPGRAGVRGTTPVPVSGRVSTGNSAILVDPTNSDRVLMTENATGRRVWASNNGGADWSQSNGNHPFAGLAGAGNNGFVVCSIAKYGVIAGLTSRTSQTVTPTFRVWKPGV